MIKNTENHVIFAWSVNKYFEPPKIYAMAGACCRIHHQSSRPGRSINHGHSDAFDITRIDISFLPPLAATST